MFFVSQIKRPTGLPDVTLMTMVTSKLVHYKFDFTIIVIRKTATDFTVMVFFNGILVFQGLF